MSVMHPSDRTYRSQTVRLTDLAVVSDSIEGITFENCMLEGPAVVALLGNTTLQDSQLDGDADALIWSVPTSRDRVVGAIALVDCTIVGCQLRRIGLAVPEDLVSRVQQGLLG